MTQHSFSQVLRTEVFTCHYVKSRNILKQIEYLWISKKFNHSQHSISMYSRMDTLLLLFCFKVTASRVPFQALGWGELDDTALVFVPWNWRTMVSPSTVLVVTGLQLLKPKFDPWSKGNQPSKSLKDFVMFQDHQDIFSEDTLLFASGHKRFTPENFLRSGAPTSWLC